MLYLKPDAFKISSDETMLVMYGHFIADIFGCPDKTGFTV
jgi:hypothetical protein